MRILTVLLLVACIVGFGLVQEDVAPLYDGDVYYLEDPGARLTLGDVQKIDWRKEAHSPINFGYSKSAYWFYIPIGPSLMSLGNRLLMEIDFPTIDELEYFHLGPDGTVKDHVTTGTTLPFTSRPIWDDDWIMPVENPQKGDALLVRAWTQNSLQMPIRFYERNRFFQLDDVDLLVWGAYYGLLLVMALYSFLNSVVIRDQLYLFYGAYVVASSLASAALNGHAFAYLWPDTPIINSYSLTIFTCLIICFGTAFAMSYLDIIATRSRARFVGYLFIWGSLITALVSVVLKVNLSFWAAIEIVAFSITLTVFGGAAVRRGHYLGNYFLVGWSVFLAGVGMFALNVLGILPFNVLTVHSKEVGSAFEIIMLSLGMSAIYNHEKEERNRIDSAIGLMKQRLQHRINLINNKSGLLEIPQLQTHLQDIRSLDRRIHTEMGRLLVISVMVIDKATQRPDYIAQGDCLRALFNSRVTVFPFKTQREGMQGEVTVLLFPLHNKFEAEPILERVEKWQSVLGDQYELHFGYAISHLTEKYEVDYIEESLHYLEEAIQRHATSYSIDDTLNSSNRAFLSAG